jgi:uncharacterized protein YecT (DUF1311 family)
MKIAIMLLMLASTAFAQTANSAEECRKVTSPSQLQQCTEQKFHSADAQVQKTYASYVALLQKRVADAQNPAEKAHATQSLDDLKASEVAWAAYRDAQCRAEADEYPNGTLQSTMRASCMESLTSERSARLNDTYSEK